MPRYRVLARFGPWNVGDEFESDDDVHAIYAANGGPVTEVDWTGYPLAERATQVNETEARSPTSVEKLESPASPPAGEESSVLIEDTDEGLDPEES